MASAALSVPPGTFRFLDLPREIQNMIWNLVHQDRRSFVQHHYFQVHSTSTRRGQQAWWSLPRCYVCIDPFHKTINDNTPVKVDAPAFRGIPGSNSIPKSPNHHISFRKVKLPSSIHYKRPTMTYATRRSRADFNPDPHRPKAEEYIYVDMHQDVFLFYNIYTFPPPRGPAPPHVGERTNEFQFLSDSMNKPVNKATTKLDRGYNGTELSWVGLIRKVAVIIHDHFQPIRHSWMVGEAGYTRWIVREVENVITRFINIDRLYLVIDAWDSACTLTPTNDDVKYHRDGFITYESFLLVHRTAQHNHGYACACRLPVVPPPDTLPHHPLFWANSQDEALVTHLYNSVGRSRIMDNSLGRFGVGWAVMKK